LNELVADGWVLKSRDSAYKPSPQLRRLIAQEKVALEVPQTNHELKIMSAVAKNLKAPFVNIEQNEDGRASAPEARHPIVSPRSTSRRRTTRFSIPSDDPVEVEAVNSAPGTTPVVVRSTTKTRSSDPSARLIRLSSPLLSTPRRRSSGSNSQNRRMTTAITPEPSPQKRNKSTSRRHTLAVLPTRQLPIVPAGVSREIQFYPLKQALSHRTKRALRRNALSEEMNNIEAEEKIGRRKNLEELMRLREELARSQQTLKELELELLAARHAPSQELDHMETVPEEPEDVDMNMDFGMAVGFGMQGDDDHSDDTPQRTPDPEQAILSATEGSVRHEREFTGSNGMSTPVSKRDKRIRDLEEQIASLREDIERRALEAQRRQEEDEVFHDAEEQILLEENISLAQRVDDLENLTPKLDTMEVRQDIVIEEAETATYMNQASRVDQDQFGDDGFLADSVVPFQSEVLTPNMPMEIDQEFQPDPRLAELQTENEQLQKSLELLNKKLCDLEEDAEGAIILSEETRQNADVLRRENEALRILGDKFSARISELEELEGERLENVANGTVQTEILVDEEKEEMLVQVGELQEVVAELQSMISAISEEKRQLETIIAETQAAIRGLENAVDAGTKGKDEIQGIMEVLRNQILGLEAKLAEETTAKSELEADLEQLREEILASVQEIGGLRLENSNLQEKLVNKDKAVQSLTEELQQITTRVSSFEVNVERLAAELCTAQEQLLIKDQSIKSLVTECSVLRDELKERAGELDDLEAEKESLEDEVGNLVSRIDELSVWQEDLQLQLSHKGEELRELKEAADGTSAEKDEAIEKVEEQMVSLEAQVAKLNGDIEELNDKVVELQDALEDASHEYRELERARDALEDELTDKNDTINELEERNQSLSEELDETQRVASDLDEKNQSLIEGLTNAEKTTAGLEQLKSSLESNAMELEVTVENLNEKVSGLENTSLNLNGQVAQLTGENTVLHKKVLGCEEISNALQAANELLQADKNSLELQVSELKGAFKALENTNTELNNQIISLQQKISSLEDDVSAADEVKEQLENTISSLRNRITILEKASEILEEEKSSANRDITRLQTRIAEIETGLEMSDAGNKDLQNELLETRTQIETFKQTISASALEKERMESQITGLYAEIEGSKKAIKVAELEKADLKDKIEKLEDRNTVLDEHVDALEAERDLLALDKSNLESDIAKVTALLEMSQKDNKGLELNIDHLEAKIVSLESALGSANSENVEYIETLKQLRSQIAELTRQAQAVDEEKYIIVQKIQPYIAGEQPLDMAVEEVLTELVMAKNQAAENEGLRRQLENKIRILAHDGESSPEELVEKLTDRFREVRERVENLYDQRRQLEDSPFSGHKLEDFAWTGSNDYALQMLGTLVDDLDSKLVAARESAISLQSNLDSEVENSTALGGYLDDIVSSLFTSGSQIQKKEIPSFVARHVLSLDTQIERLEDRLAELEEIIHKKDNTIRNLQTDLTDAEAYKSVADSQIAEAKAYGEATHAKLTDAQQKIQKLEEEADEDRMEIDELEQRISVHERVEEDFRQQLGQQATLHEQALEAMKREKEVAIAALGNKLAEAVDGKNHLESRFANTIAEYSSQIQKLEAIVTESKQETQDRNSYITNLQREYQTQIQEFQSRIDDADQEISILEQELRGAQAKADIDVASLQTQLEESKLDAEERILAVEAQLSEQQSLAEKLQSKLDQRIAEIKSLSDEISQLREATIAHREALESKICDLENNISNARFEALREKVRLEQIIQEREADIAHLKTTEAELVSFLDEAEISEADLDERLKRSEAEHQLSIEEAAKERTSLQAQISSVQAQLQQTREHMAQIQEDLDSDNAALRTLVDEKKQQIESLRSGLTDLTSEKRTLEIKVSRLELEKRELEEELELEREKGREVIDNLQQEAQKFMNRLGDRKGQYIREQKLRESKKRVHADISVEGDEKFSKFIEPLSPPSTIQKEVTTKHVPGKKRRINGDSGIGVELDDEGFEGSVSMGSQRAV
jgi:chromosome segregation ATPase